MLRSAWLAPKRATEKPTSRPPAPATCHARFTHKRRCLLMARCPCRRQRAIARTEPEAAFVARHDVLMALVLIVRLSGLLVTVLLHLDGVCLARGTRCPVRLSWEVRRVRVETKNSARRALRGEGSSN